MVKGFFFQIDKSRALRNTTINQSLCKVTIAAMSCMYFEWKMVELLVDMQKLSGSCHFLFQLILFNEDWLIVEVDTCWAVSRPILVYDTFNQDIIRLGYWLKIRVWFIIIQDSLCIETSRHIIISCDFVQGMECQIMCVSWRGVDRCNVGGFIKIYCPVVTVVVLVQLNFVIVCCWPGSFVFYQVVLQVLAPILWGKKLAQGKWWLEQVLDPKGMRSSFIILKWPLDFNFMRELYCSPNSMIYGIHLDKLAYIVLDIICDMYCAAFANQN